MLYSKFHGKNYGTETFLYIILSENYGRIKSIFRKKIQKNTLTSMHLYI